MCSACSGAGRSRVSYSTRAAAPAVAAESSQMPRARPKADRVARWSVVPAGVIAGVRARACSTPEGSRPAAAGPRVARPRAARPGVAGPGVAAPAVARPGAGRPGVAAPAVSRPRVARPGVSRPGVARPGVAVPAAARPGVARRLRGGEVRRVERCAEDVPLALEHDVVAGEVVLAARVLDRALAVRVVVLLRVALRRLAEHRRHLDLAGALGLALLALQVQRVLREEALDLVGREVRELLQDERDRSGGDRSGLGGAAAAEVAAGEEALRVVHVDERVGVA